MKDFKEYVEAASQFPSGRTSDQRKAKQMSDKKEEQSKEHSKEVLEMQKLNSDPQWKSALNDLIKGGHVWNINTAEYYSDLFNTGKKMIKKYPKLVNNFSVSDGDLQYTFTSKNSEAAFRQSYELIRNGHGDPHTEMPNEVNIVNGKLSFFVD